MKYLAELYIDATELQRDGVYYVKDLLDLDRNAYVHTLEFDAWNEVKRLRAEKPVTEITADKIFEIAAPRTGKDTAVAFTRERLQDALDTIREEKQNERSYIEPN